MLLKIQNVLPRWLRRVVLCATSSRTRPVQTACEQPFPATQAQVALDGIRHDFFSASLHDVRRSLQLGHQRRGDPDTAV
jgi:hypothetical protein